jgi:hypothetical protein
MRDVYVVVGLVVVVIAGFYLGYSMTISSSASTAAPESPIDAVTDVGAGLTVPTKNISGEKTPENVSKTLDNVTENLTDQIKENETNRTQDASGSDDSWADDIVVQVSTDKYDYKSYDEMEITVIVDSPVIVDEVMIELRGIVNDWGVSKLKLNKKTSLSEGPNVVKFDYTVPKCYGCAGLKAGEYSINAKVLYNDIGVSNASTEVSIQK